MRIRRFQWVGVKRSECMIQETHPRPISAVACTAFAAALGLTYAYGGCQILCITPCPNLSCSEFSLVFEGRLPGRQFFHGAKASPCGWGLGFGFGPEANPFGHRSQSNIALVIGTGAALAMKGAPRNLKVVRPVSENGTPFSWNLPANPMLALEAARHVACS